MGGCGIIGCERIFCGTIGCGSIGCGSIGCGRIRCVGGGRGCAGSPGGGGGRWLLGLGGGGSVGLGGLESGFGDADLHAHGVEGLRWRRERTRTVRRRPASMTKGSERKEESPGRSEDSALSSKKAGW